MKKNSQGDPSEKKICYSTYFEVQLDEKDFGLSRKQHNKICNEKLLAKIMELDKQNIQFCDMVSNQDLIYQLRSKKNLSPSGFTWEHCSTAATNGRLGVMRLVPKDQHIKGSPFWSVFHPDVWGGYFEWAMPAGAPHEDNLDKYRDLFKEQDGKALGKDQLPLYLLAAVYSNDYTRFSNAMQQAKALFTSAELEEIFTKTQSVGKIYRPDTLTHVAIKHGNPLMVNDIFNCFSQKKKVLSITNHEGDTIAHVAAKFNRNAILIVLKNLGADFSSPNKKAESVSQIAAQVKQHRLSYDTVAQTKKEHQSTAFSSNNNPSFFKPNQPPQVHQRTLETNSIKVERQRMANANKVECESHNAKMNEIFAQQRAANERQRVAEAARVTAELNRANLANLQRTTIAQANAVNQKNTETIRAIAERQGIEANQAERANAERQRADANRIDAERRRADALRADAERQRDNAIRANADRQRDDANRANADRQRADANRANADRQRADANRANAERQRTEANRAYVQRQGAEAQRANTMRHQAELNRRAPDASRANADRLRAAESARAADRQRNDANRANVDRQRAAENARVITERQRADANRANIERQRAAEATRANNERQRVAEANRAAEQRRAAEIARANAERQRVAEANRVAEQRRAAEIARANAERQRIAEANRVAEQRRAMEMARANAERQRIAEANRAAEQRRAMEIARANTERQRVAEANRVAEQRRAAELARANADRQRAEATRAADRQRAADIARAQQAQAAAISRANASRK